MVTVKNNIALIKMFSLLNKIRFFVITLIESGCTTIR